VSFQFEVRGTDATGKLTSESVQALVQCGLTPSFDLVRLAVVVCVCACVAVYGLYGHGSGFERNPSR